MPFSVRDTGPGIDDSVIRTLYEPVRRRHSGAGSFSGSGLGLVISRKLLERMGSALHVETRPGWGTRFFFELLALCPMTRLTPAHSADGKAVGKGKGGSTEPPFRNLAYFVIRTVNAIPGRS